MNQDEQNRVSQETNLEEAARKDGAAEVDANTNSDPSDPNSQDPQWQSKEAYEKRVQEFAFLPELNKKIHIALMVLIVSIAFLVLFLLTPLGSILPTYGGGGRQIPASPFVGVALLAAFTAYAVIVNSTKRISNIKGGKHKKYTYYLSS